MGNSELKSSMGLLIFLSLIFGPQGNDDIPKRLLGDSYIVITLGTHQSYHSGSQPSHWDIVSGNASAVARPLRLIVSGVGSLVRGSLAHSCDNRILGFSSGNSFTSVPRY